MSVERVPSSPSPSSSPLERIARFPRDLVVRAGAGTGKTHALVTLYLPLVGGVTAARRRVAPPRIAVVTFTDKAAGELKERIRARLGAIVAEPAALERLEPTLAAAARELGVALPEPAAWAEALASLGAAPIGTFHTFCANLLRRHAARAGLDPEYTLLDEAEVGARATQAAERAILDALTVGDGDVEELVAQYNFRANGRARGLVELLVELRARRAEEGRGAAGLEGNYEPAAVQREFDAAVARFGEVARGVGALAQELGPKTKSAPLARELAARVATLDFTRSDDAAAFVGAAKRLAGAAVGSWKEALKLAAERLSLARTSRRAVPLAAALARLLAAVDGGYRAHKKRAGVVDFSDLLTMARDLLRDDGAVRASVRARFDAVLGDAFQHTNPVPAELVRLVGGRHPDDDGARLFVGGDRKQSIYEFRGADVA
ncbi:MAG: UvrD-helicase domain-containing protein, partial [Polyangia bacterium]